MTVPLNRRSTKAELKEGASSPDWGVPAVTDEPFLPSDSYRKTRT